MSMWGNAWEAMLRTLLEMPLLGRLAAGSAEFVVLAAAVRLGIAVFRLRSPRLMALLWFVVLLKPLSVLVAGNPFPLMVIEAVHAEQQQEAAAVTSNPPPVPPAAAVVFSAVSLARETGHPSYLEQQDHALKTALAMSHLFKAKDTQPVLPPATRSSGKIIAQVVAGFWLFGIGALLLWAVVDRIRLSQLVRCAEEPDAALRAVYARCAAPLRARALPRVRITERFESPAIAGVVRPVILLPKWLATEPSGMKTYWAIRHELMHWRHGDPVANAIRNLAQVLFFFHPVVWWAGRKWEEAMEFACDRALVESESDVANYAEQLFAMLAEVHTRRRHALPSGLFATRTQIGQRLTLLLQNSLRVPARLSRKALCAIVLAGLCTVLFGTQFGGVTHAQQTTPGVRTLQFPEDRSMGQISIRPWGAMYNAEWQDYQDARGAVQIPANTEASLQVSETACVDLSPLAQLRADDLQGISFQRTPVTDADLAYIEGMSALRDVHLGGTSIGDKGLSYLQNISTIDELILRDTRVTDSGMSYVENLSHMKFLMLNMTDVTDEGIAHIANMSELEVLDLFNVAITDKGAQYLQNLTSLRELGAEDTQLGDEALSYLANLPNLFGMNLQGTKITDAGVKYLMQMPLLSAYSIRNTRITDEGIEQLMNNPHLMGMYVPLHTSPETIAKLNGHMGVLQLDVPGTNDLQRVRVTDAETEEGIAGALVEVFTHMDGRPVHANEVTGEDGRLALYAPKGEFDDILVTISAKGYGRTQMDFQRDSGKEFVFSLTKSMELGGRVMDEAGAPVVKASVGLPMANGASSGEMEARNIVARTDAQGAWKCDELSADKTEFSIKAEHPEFEPGLFAVPGDVTLASLQDKTAVFTLRKAMEISGKVADINGVPVKGARIRIQEQDWRGLKLKAETLADDMGQFTIGPCPPGKNILRAHAPGFGVTEQSVEVAHGMGKVHIVLKPPRIVSGRIVGMDSKPVDKVSVLLDGEALFLRWAGVTDAAGTFAWKEAPEGELVCALEKKGFASTGVILLPPQEQEYVLTLLPEIHVTGSVVEAETGNKIPAFKIGLRLVNVPEKQQDAKMAHGAGPWRRLDGMPLTGRDGRYDVSPAAFVYAHADIADIPQAMVIVRIEADGYLAGESEPFRLDAPARRYNFQLSKRRPMTGRVLAADGTPIAGAALVAAGKGQEMVIEDGTAPDTAPRTGDNGVFTIPAPAPPFIVCAIHDSGFAALSMEKAQDGTELRLQPWSTITGEVKVSTLRKEGQKVTTVCTMGDKGATIVGQTSAACDANGMFSVSRVPAGGATVGLTMEHKNIPLWLSHTTAITVEPGQTAHVEIGGTGRPVTGRVAQYADTIHWRCVGEAPADGTASMFAVSIKQDGTFRIEALPSGVYTIEELQPSKRADFGTPVGFGPLTVPEIPGGHSDDVLDAGVLQAKTPNPGQ